jgi:protein phosphatase PTC7
MVTTRDVFKVMSDVIGNDCDDDDDGNNGNNNDNNNNNGNNNGNNNNNRITLDANTTLDTIMTPLSRLVFVRPNETVSKATEVMAHTGRVMLPVITVEGRVEGIITASDIIEFGTGTTAEQRGGKKQFLEDMVGRTGTELGSMADPPGFIGRQTSGTDGDQLYVNVGEHKLPHPFKTETGVAGNRRLFGPNDYSTDVTLSEDSSFVYKCSPASGITYAGVADGVGSWRQYGVDPRDFSRELMKQCEGILKKAAKKDKGLVDGSNKNKDGSRRESLPLSDILKQAHEKVIEKGVVGSTTATLMAFNNRDHVLSFSNMGDSGIIVLRHVYSDKNVDAGLKVTFVSQQQLQSFNHPYQFGYTGEPLAEDEVTSLKTHADLYNETIPLRRGDIVILATDGLFDNVDIDEIQLICSQWEEENGFVAGNVGGTKGREDRWTKGKSLTNVSKDSVGKLAERLVKVSRERSLDNSVDSPFAILAKENDIMWSGGMPDDCTVVVCHVVGSQANS